MPILLILILFFFAVSVGLLWAGLAVWAILKRRQHPDKEIAPPVKKSTFLAAAVPGAILALVILPAELLCLQGIFDFRLQGGSTVFILLFLISFIAAVHAYAWGTLNARKVPGGRSLWQKMALVSAVILGSPLVIILLFFSLFHFVRASIQFAPVIVLVLLPGFLLLTPTGRSFGFPDPASCSKLKAFAFPFLLGVYTGFLGGFLEILLLLAASGSGGMETGAAAGLLLVMVCIASVVGVANGVWWGMLNLHRAPEKDLPWTAFARALGLSLLLPVVMAVMGGGIAVFLFSFRELTVLWLIALGFGALIGLAYWLLKASKSSADKEAAEPPPPSPLEPAQPISVPAEAPSADEPMDERQVFWKTFAYVGVLVLVVSIGFGVGARMAIVHWANNPGGGGWLNFSGMVESMILWGLQILASVLCFYGGFTVASSLSLGGGVRLRFSLPYGVVLGLIAVVANFVIDALIVISLMFAHGVL